MNTHHRLSTCLQSKQVARPNCRRIFSLRGVSRSNGRKRDQETQRGGLSVVPLRSERSGEALALYDRLLDPMVACPAGTRRPGACGVLQKLYLQYLGTHRLARTFWALAVLYSYLNDIPSLIHLFVSHRNRRIRTRNSHRNVKTAAPHEYWWGLCEASFMPA